jgi:hypothetical protein
MRARPEIAAERDAAGVTQKAPTLTGLEDEDDDEDENENEAERATNPIGRI